jgi:1-acyl-sn-glycerol-3-phosphate acyltransferase
MLRYWRRSLGALFPFDVEGLENVPAESCLFIANHNIGAAVEILSLLEIWQTHFKNRVVYGLAHPFAFRIPGFREELSKMGAIPATYESAYEAFDQGASIIIFPGGNWESCRPFWDRGVCDFGGHYGWAKIGLNSKKRVVPISISGSHSLNPVLLRSRWLTNILILPRLLGLTSFPVSISQIFWGGLLYFLTRHFTAMVTTMPSWLCLFSFYLGFVFTPLWPIFPGRLRVRFGKPVDLQALTEGLPEKEKLDIVYARILSEVQEGMMQ